MTSKRSFWRHAEEGAVAVEAAVTFLVLMFLIVGSVQFGLVFWNWNTMLLAVEEAGRYAMLYNPTNYPNGPPSASCSLGSPTLATCAQAWGNQNWGNNFGGGVSCTAPSGSPLTMTCTATYTFNIYIASITLSRGIQVPVI
jgi:Flp pilus assembly protein TadG